MKCIIYLDFLNKDSYELVDKLIDINKKKDIDVEIIGYDYNASEDINNAYYGYNYAKKFGVGLEYLHLLLKKYHVDEIDISSMDVVAKSFEELGYEKFNMLDALHEGEYKLMQDYLDYKTKSNNIDCDIYAYVYDEEHNRTLVKGKDAILKLF
ncbi:MAG: hypothetical protein LBR40_02460 [Bacilli bacterium]|nr:hypothetical protein [Bacilli bacterium]